MGLKQKDYLNLLACSTELNELVLEDEFPELAVNTLRRLIPGDYASYNSWNLKTGFFDASSRPYEVPSENFPVLVRLLDEHPLVPHIGKIQAVRTTDFLPHRDFLESPLYRDYYRFLDVRYQLGIGLLSTSYDRVALVINRSLRDFSKRDCTVLNLIGPALVRSFKNARALTKIKMKLRSFRGNRSAGPLRINGPELTDRECETLKWIAEGKSTWDISVIMGISERTVKFHADNVIEKLKVTNRAQAVATAFAKGIISPD